MEKNEEQIVNGRIYRRLKAHEMLLSNTAIGRDMDNMTDAEKEIYKQGIMVSVYYMENKIANSSHPISINDRLYKVELYK